MMRICCVRERALESTSYGLDPCDKGGYQQTSFRTVFGSMSDRENPRAWIDRKFLDVLDGQNFARQVVVISDYFAVHHKI
jgi:hypothetical protein